MFQPSLELKLAPAATTPKPTPPTLRPFRRFHCHVLCHLIACVYAKKGHRKLRFSVTCPRTQLRRLPRPRPVPGLSPSHRPATSLTALRSAPPFGSTAARARNAPLPWPRRPYRKGPPKQPSGRGFPSALTTNRQIFVQCNRTTRKIHTLPILPRFSRLSIAVYAGQNRFCRFVPLGWLRPARWRWPRSRRVGPLIRRTTCPTRVARQSLQACRQCHQSAGSTRRRSTEALATVNNNAHPHNRLVDL